MRSLFVMAARRGRGSKDDMLQQLDVVEKLYGKHAGSGDGLAIARLAFKHNLTSYDATYLALALDQRGAARHARQGARRRRESGARDRPRAAGRVMTLTAKRPSAIDALRGAAADGGARPTWPSRSMRPRSTR